VAETCDGTSDDCPPDRFAPASTVCRPAAGECDVAESCTGTDADCPADARRLLGTTCTDDDNPCTTDVCDGSEVDCQHPAGNMGVMCRPTVGDCDAAEFCDGLNPECPGDEKSTAVCRAAAGACDAAERCDGVHN